jgi:hypothetical protein
MEWPQLEEAELAVWASCSTCSAEWEEVEGAVPSQDSEAEEAAAESVLHQEAAE